MCDDVAATVEELAAKSAEFVGDVSDRLRPHGNAADSRRWDAGPLRAAPIPSRSTSDRDAATPPAYAGKGGSNGTPVVSGGVCATFRTMDSMVK